MCLQWREILYHIGIAVKEVLAVGSVYAAFCLTDKQPIFAQQRKKIISSHNYIMLLKKRLQHDIKFAPSTAWLMGANSINLINDNPLNRELQQGSFLLLMICLNRETQQSANVSQTAMWLCLFYFVDCWVPDFFLMEILSCFSATSISLSNTTLRSSSYCN